MRITNLLALYRDDAHCSTAAEDVENIILFCPCTPDAPKCENPWHRHLSCF